MAEMERKMKRIVGLLFNSDKLFIWLGLASFFFGLMPLVIYAWGRGTGIILNEEQWGLLGYNHGPWWENEWSSFLIAIPMLIIMILCFVTLVICIFRSVMNPRLSFLFHGIILCVVQVTFYYVHFNIILWTID